MNEETQRLKVTSALLRLLHHIGIKTAGDPSVRVWIAYLEQKVQLIDQAQTSLKKN